MGISAGRIALLPTLSIDTADLYFSSEKLRWTDAIILVTVS
jgi:hypothetical protein